MKKLLLAITLWAFATCIIAFASCTTSTSGHRLDGTKKVKARQLSWSNTYFKYTVLPGYETITIDSLYIVGDTVIHDNGEMYIIY